MTRSSVETPPVEQSAHRVEGSPSSTHPGTGSSGKRRIALALLLFLAGLLIAGMVKPPEPARSATDALAAGSQSARAAEIGKQLPAKDTSTAVVLFSSDSRISPQALGQLAGKARELGGQKAPFIPAKDGTAVTVPITLDGVGASGLKTKVDDLRSKAKSGLPQGVSAQVTGPAAIQADLANVFTGANTRLLMVTALVVAVLLVVTYRSPVLWLIPLLVVGVADRVASIVATHVLHATGVAWDESTTGILSVLVFGAGTDYALLLISRYRDELRRHENRHEAMALTVRRTVEPVLASSVTVFVGLATLLLSLFPTTRGLGLACAVGVLVAALFALVVLPGILTIFGRWIFWPRVPRVGEAVTQERSSIWHRIGAMVARRPGAVTGVSLLVLLLAGLGLFSVKTGLSDSDQFLKTPESIAASERLAKSFPAGSSSPMTLVTRASGANEVREKVAKVDGVSNVTPTGGNDSYRQFQVITSVKPGSTEAERTVEKIRQATAGYPETYLGGGDAQRVDESAGTTRDRWVILPLVLLLVTLGLGLLLRSVVAPLILVATVACTFVAALGLSWWIFQLIGFERLDASAPLTIFVFLVALGVDYNIFLVTRAREEASEHGHEQGFLRALAATGGVITSAGILLAAVFAVLGVLPLVVLAQIGVVIFVGVLLDTLLVRTVLVPAIALMLGEKFWWPRRPAQETQKSSGEHQLPVR